MSQPIELTPSALLDFQPLGNGISQRGCGQLRSIGHISGTDVHGLTTVFRCHRADCPTCFDKPHGYIDRASSRILAGIGRGLLPGREDQLREFTVRVQHPDDLLDPQIRSEILYEVRQALKDRLLEPGAWILHARDVPGQERCGYDQGAHLHIFARVKGPHRLPETIGGWRANHQVQLREPGRPGEPGLVAALRGMVRLRVASSPGWPGRAPKMGRWMNTIGWFGRRSAGGGPSEGTPTPPPAPEPAIYCPTCARHVATTQWGRVQPRQFRPDKEGSWVVPCELAVMDSLRQFERRERQ